MLAHVILGLLRDGRRTHGYDLAKAYRERSGRTVASGSFYRELGHLVRAALIMPTGRVAGADARRLPYEITDKGRLAFDAWLEADGVDADLAPRLLFLDQLGPAARALRLDRWQAALGGQLDRLRAEQRHLADTAGRRGAAGPPDLRPLLLARRIRHVRADLAFLHDVRRAIRRWTAASPEDPAVARRPVAPLATSLRLSPVESVVA